MSSAGLGPGVGRVEIQLQSTLLLSAPWLWFSSPLSVECEDEGRHTVKAPLCSRGL